MNCPKPKDCTAGHYSAVPNRRPQDGRLLLWLFALATIGVVFAIARLALAADDIVVRPDPVGISATSVQTNALGATLRTCLVADGLSQEDMENPVFQHDCKEAVSGGVTAHTILVPEGAGNVTMRAITGRREADGTDVWSGPSHNSKTVLDVPAPPDISD